MYARSAITTQQGALDKEYNKKLAGAIPSALLISTLNRVLVSGVSN
jgi:hypothetical protein